MMRMAISLRLRASNFGTFSECCMPLCPGSRLVNRHHVVPNDFRHEGLPALTGRDPSPDFARRDVVEGVHHPESFDTAAMREMRRIGSRSRCHQQAELAYHSLKHTILSVIPAF